MLVTCPECGAGYEIDGSLIPPEGRRVQCSACNHVWQQDPDEAEVAAHPPAEETPRPPPPLAEDVKSILRGEAEHEARVRRERGLVEIRPELTPRAGAPARHRHTRTSAGTLPDAEAINATLRAASEHAAEAHGRRPRRPERGGFAAGLAVGLLLVGLAAAVYLTAPRISDAVPQAAPALEAYVGLIDDLRVTLDRTAERAVAAVSDLLPSDG